MCVSHMGDFIVSGGHDRSLHLYKRTEEQVFIEEERELEQEQQIDQELDEQYKNPNIVYDEPEEEEGEGGFPETPNPDEPEEGNDEAN